MVCGYQAPAESLIAATVVGGLTLIRGMIGELAIETLRIMRAAPCNYTGYDVAWSGPSDRLWFTGWRPINAVKPFGDPSCAQSFFDLGTDIYDFALLSEVVMPFFGDVVFQPFE